MLRLCPEAGCRAPSTCTQGGRWPFTPTVHLQPGDTQNLGWYLRAADYDSQAPVHTSFSRESRGPETFKMAPS